MFTYFFILFVATAVNADPIRLRAANIRDLSGRIVGGESTTIEAHPYQVSLQDSFEHNCGASIISAHYVVSAAHCTIFLENGQLENITVRAGSTFKNKGGSVHQVEWFKNHENFTFNDHYQPIFDITVMRVKQPFHFDDTRQPIKLMDKKVKPGLMATVTGWGVTQSEPNKPDQLQVVSLPVIDKKDCHKAYFELMGGIPDNQLCAGYLGQGGKDACQGDSGGPMVINGKLAGVVSWGWECARPEYPGVYTEVSHLRDWIIKNAEL